MANLTSLTVNNTSALSLPSGTDSQRFGSNNGEMRFNTDTATLENRNNSSWTNRRKIVRDGLSMHLDSAHPESVPWWDPYFSSWYDISGNGNNMFRTGNSISIVNNAVEIPSTASGEYFRLLNNAYAALGTGGGLRKSLDFRDGQTVMIWMKHAFTSGRRNIWNQSYGGYGTWTHESGNNINYYWGDGGGNANPYSARNSGTTTRNVWNCMCVTRTTSTVSWYNGGVLTSSVSNSYGSLTTDANNIQIGYGYTGVQWYGQIGIILMYNRGLTAAEVRQNYEATKERFE